MTCLSTCVISCKMDKYKFETILPGNLTWPEGSTGIITSPDGNYFLIGEERVFIDFNRYEDFFSETEDERYWPRYALCMPAIPVNSLFKSSSGRVYKMHLVVSDTPYPFWGVNETTDIGNCSRTLFGTTYNNIRLINDENWVEVTHVGDGEVLPLESYNKLWEYLTFWPGQANREALEACYKRIHGE